jgi:hypothetical protein
MSEVDKERGDEFSSRSGATVRHVDLEGKSPWGFRVTTTTAERGSAGCGMAHGELFNNSLSLSTLSTSSNSSPNNTNSNSLVISKVSLVCPVFRPYQ